MIEIQFQNKAERTYFGLVPGIVRLNQWSRTKDPNGSEVRLGQPTQPQNQQNQPPNPQTNTINLKTTEGVAQFEAIASDVADLVLEFGGALSGEHGDGLVRGPFMERMFGSQLYGAFRDVKRTFDPDGLFNPGKIVDTPPLTSKPRST